MTPTNFKTRWKTVWVIAILVVLLIGWDVYVAFFAKGAGDTISEVALSYAKKYPIIPYLVGVVSGHLWWPQIENHGNTN